ncbi:conserved hypothetical protein [Aspergillus terreus NIH2624]|uniref:Gamma interferon inducible lysosomal thiol reductase n=1 Tax=Aspergillus terreus (strain NIH 2624 / FGSC A1156) TaxID=341663 RepID=Q0CV39_ASPTN|nr:uncharacterized protein ATEG_02445 [Aspergillus terreus NIH2624]EAU37407.1 conserved hypothetical protein [Aspergillus terreus NIH2624]
MEKTQLSHSHPHSVSPERSTRPSPSKVRRVVHAAVGLSFALLLFLYIPRSGLLSSHQTIRRFHCGFFSSPDNDAQRLIRPMEPLEDRTHHANKVPLEAHIMSKCPDAQYCLRKLVVPTMERVSDLVDFNLAFIANVSDKSSGITCMHGPEECVGDSLILCAENLPFNPDGDSTEPIRMPTIRSLGFANCLISSYQEIPDRELVHHCALQHGIDFEALNACVSRQEDDPNGKELSGLALLRESALHSAELGVKTSCTLRLDDEVCMFLT